jgi:hypothetical protein
MAGWMGDVIGWEILEFRAESFQRLFSPPRREESDSVVRADVDGSEPENR